MIGLYYITTSFANKKKKSTIFLSKYRKQYGGKQKLLHSFLYYFLKRLFEGAGNTRKGVSSNLFLFTTSEDEEKRDFLT